MDNFLTTTLPWIGKFGAWLGVFLAPVKAIMLAVSALIIFDLISGIWASLKSGRKITSNGIRRTVTKTLAYQATIITSLIMEQYFIPGVPVIRVVAAMIAVTEFKSFLENTAEITGLDLWSEVLKKLHGKKLPIPEVAEPVAKKKPTRRRKATKKRTVRKKARKTRSKKS